ncbi:MAG: pyridoxal phosphate-dependent aminotransferase [Lysinibacillus sp.]
MGFSNKLQSLPEQFFAKLAARVAAKVAAGHDVINLGQGNPDQPTFPHIIESLQQAATNPLNHKYPPFLGVAELRQAAVDFYKREYGVELDVDTEVAILGGTKIGLVELPLALLNEGDTMLLPDPGYPDYLSGVALAGAKFEPMPLVASNQFLPDYEALSDEVKAAAKLMYINYPNNPTGATADIEFYEKTVEFAREHNVAVAHDFAYGAIGFDEKKPVSFLQAKGAKEVGIELYTLSKSYNMAGWRVGFAVGNAKMIAAINLLQDHLFCSIFPAIQYAAATALSGDQSEVEALRATYERRRNVLIEEAHRIGWDVTAPSGSFFAWLPVPNGYTSEQFTELLLEEVNIAVASGNGFGEFGEGYVRVGLLSDEARLKEAMARIEKLGIFDRINAY